LAGRGDRNANQGKHEERQTVNYSFGNKRQWRRWVWNRISDRCENPRDSIVLFLAGPDALDVEVAIRHGFSAKNMIAVEKDKETVKRLRELGILTIEGDLCQVLTAWPDSKPVGAVVADFCCGMEKSIIYSVAPIVWKRPAFSSSTFAFNFLRGRDASSNQLRKYHETKHRGDIFFSMLVAAFSLSTEFRNIFDALDYDDLNIALSRIGRSMQPSFMSYKSVAGTQKFDTVVFSACTKSLGLTFVPNPEYKGLSDDLIAQRRRTAAVLAHHTRRQAASAR
jgi:hypothetical protein